MSGSVEVVENELIFSDNSQDGFNAFHAGCGALASPILNDGKRPFFLFAGFVVYFEQAI